MSRVLYITYDLDKRECVGANLDGRGSFVGVGSAILSKDKVSLLDREGRDLLAPVPTTNSSAGLATDEDPPLDERALAKAAADIAACFGVPTGRNS